jgi:uncharacterized protein (TIGR02996 family)
MSVASDRDSFMRHICEQPADDTPRLIYADWLEEHGGESERAQYIRLSVRLDAIDRCPKSGDRYFLLPPGECDHCDIAHRMNAIYEKFHRQAEGESQSLGCKTVTLSRGFVSHIQLSTAAFHDHAEAIFRSHPITSVQLTDGIFLREYGGGDDRWAVYRSTIGSDLFNILCPGNRGEPWAETTDRQALETSLSFACVIYGRKLADLPPLTTGPTTPTAATTGATT